MYNSGRDSFPERCFYSTPPSHLGSFNSFKGTQFPPFFQRCSHACEFLLKHAWQSHQKHFYFIRRYLLNKKKSYYWWDLKKTIIEETNVGCSPQKICQAKSSTLAQVKCWALLSRSSVTGKDLRWQVVIHAPLDEYPTIYHVPTAFHEIKEDRENLEGPAPSLLSLVFSSSL